MPTQPPKAPTKSRGAHAARPVSPTAFCAGCAITPRRSEEHTSELQSLMRISYAVFCLKKKTINKNKHHKQIHYTKKRTRQIHVNTTQNQNTSHQLINTINHKHYYY